MKTSTTIIMGLLAACLVLFATGCASSGGMSGIGMRANGNQSIVLNQEYAGTGQNADPTGSGVSGNPEARQGGAGGIVNNFYIGANSSAQQAEKSTDALKAAISAAVAQEDATSGDSGVDKTPAPKPNPETPAPPEEEDTPETP